LIEILVHKGNRTDHARQEQGRQKASGLQKQEHILGTLELGYPAVRFRNKVESKTMSIVWDRRRLDD